MIDDNVINYLCCCRLIWKKKCWIFFLSRNESWASQLGKITFFLFKGSLSLSPPLLLEVSDCSHLVYEYCLQLHLKELQFFIRNAYFASVVWLEAVWSIIVFSFCRMRFHSWSQQNYLPLQWSCTLRPHKTKYHFKFFIHSFNLWTLTNDLHVEHVSSVGIPRSNQR